MRERVGHQVLRSEDPAAVWASWSVLGVQVWLKVKERRAGWDRFIWQALLALQNLKFVRKAEHKVFSKWYTLRFDPHKAARRLGDKVLPSLQDDLSKSEMSLKRCALGLILLLILDVLASKAIMNIWNLGDVASTITATIALMYATYLMFELTEAVQSYRRALRGVKQLQRTIARRPSAR
jgi:hypothetical protein